MNEPLPNATDVPQGQAVTPNVPAPPVLPVSPTAAVPVAQPFSYADARRLIGLVAFLAVGYLLVNAVAATLILFVVVFGLALLLNPIVVALEKRGIKRALAVVLILLAIAGVAVGAIMLVVPPLLQQINGLAARAPEYWKAIQTQAEALGSRYPVLRDQLPDIKELQDSAGLDASKLGGYASRVVVATFGLLGAIVGSVVALLLLVFTLLNPEPLVSGFLCAVPARHRDASARVIARMQQQMLAWGRATIINGIITGLSTGILLHFVGVQPALVFGVLAFFGEFVPNLGPLVAAVPALFVALGTSPSTFGMALAAILFVQQVESNLLVPFVMGRSMELHPVTIVFFALAMGSLLGIVGAILAVPTAALAKILFDEFYWCPQHTSEAEVQARAAEIVAGKGAEKSADAA